MVCQCQHSWADTLYCPPFCCCCLALQLVTQPERHLREEYTPLHRRLGEEQRRRSTKMALARLQQVGWGGCARGCGQRSRE